MVQSAYLDKLQSANKRKVKQEKNKCWDQTEAVTFDAVDWGQ